MKFTSLEDVIRKNIMLPSRASARGWYPVLCKVCNDHGQKGPRAGFRFDNDCVSYHCFNCKKKAKHNATESTLSDNMIDVLSAFGVPDDEWKSVILAGFANIGHTTKHVTDNISLDTPEITLPDSFYRAVDSEHDKWTLAAKEYLESRGLSLDFQPFYLSNEEEWVGRLIIPIYREKKLIFYQGRDMGVGYQNKYKSAPIPKEGILYGFDNIYNSDTEAPLFVVEGFFDAAVLDGVATLGNEMSPQQVKHLHRCKRQKIIIPDRTGDGHLLAKQALQNGWSVSIPDVGNGCKDMNDAVLKYGKLYVVDSILKHTMTGIVAETAIGVYCEKSKQQKPKRGQRGKFRQ